MMYRREEGILEGSVWWILSFLGLDRCVWRQKIGGLDRSRKTGAMRNGERT